MAFFWSEIGSGFGDAGGTPPPKFQGVPPGMLGSVSDVYALHGVLKSHAQLGVNTLYSF